MKHTFSIFLLFVCLSVQGQVTSFEIDSSKFIKPLTKTLDSLFHEDQDSRLNLGRAIAQKESTVIIDSLRKIMVQKDKQNLVLVKRILDQYGWLGPQKVGLQASQALFLVLQHAELSVQKFYLPLILKAEKQGEILSSNLAIMEDRINVREGKKQLYGSQGFQDSETGQLLFYPIEDPDHIDERRKMMGLGTMQEYASLLKTEWNIQKYKEMLPIIIQKVAKHKQ